MLCPGTGPQQANAESWSQLGSLSIPFHRAQDYGLSIWVPQEETQQTPQHSGPIQPSTKKLSEELRGRDAYRDPGE